MLLEVHDVPTAVIETITNLREKSLPLLVEIPSFVTVAFGRVELIDDLIETLSVWLALDRIDLFESFCSNIA